MLTSPFDMPAAKLLGQRMPTGLRYYFPDTPSRDAVWQLWVDDAAQGLTIEDLDPVPVLADGPDYKVLMINNVVTMTTLSNTAFDFVRPEIEAGKFRERQDRRERGGSRPADPDNDRPWPTRRGGGGGSKRRYSPSY